MIPVFILHPFKGSGDEREANTSRIKRIAEGLAKMGYMPVSPIHAFGWLDDAKPLQREAGLDYSLRLLQMVLNQKGKVCVCADIVQLLGSQGCRAELQELLQWPEAKIISGVAE